MLHFLNPELQLKYAESVIKKKHVDWIKRVWICYNTNFSFWRDNKRKYDTFCSNWKGKIVINESYIDGIFESIYTPAISNLPTSLGKCSGWIIYSVVEHNISISKYISKTFPLAVSSYIKLPKEFDHPRKGLINIQNMIIMNDLNGL